VALALALGPAGTALRGPGAASVEAAQGTQDTRANLVHKTSHLLPPGFLLAAAYPPPLQTFAAAAAGVALAPPTLQALVERLTLPGHATDDTNDVCAAILLHPDFSKNPSVLSMYTKMNGGLRNYLTGTAHAWLYTPRKRPSRMGDSDLDYVSDSLALVFVYPDDHAPTAGNDEGDSAKPRNKLHFGGRAYPLWNNSVLLQHGAHKPLGFVLIGGTTLSIFKRIYRDERFLFLAAHRHSSSFLLLSGSRRANTSSLPRKHRWGRQHPLRCITRQPTPLLRSIRQSPIRRQSNSFRINCQRCCQHRYHCHFQNLIGMVYSMQMLSVSVRNSKTAISNASSLY
jgi:hypothetical protein